MVKFLERLMGRPPTDEYVEVDLGQFEDEPERPRAYLRVAELTSLDVLPEIKQEIRSQNILLIDIAPMKRDKASLDRAIGELRKIVEDMAGDIAGVGDDLVIIVPSGIRIDREKVVGGKD
ncbi:MAG: cell division protein SepF [Methanothrix sp.]|jgi:Uncharacterized conserved protein|uniref:Cell division protein SepF n=1 Tax=Methanothrix thermoacetophila (strain DSM 6194 / JCM 14653 / NBRC 101360 / PT) TaxID=349307 RepID=A0B937_METTP|nr:MULTISPECIES: cell division protein SepF [Methanothrix]ABK15211.1 Protein of unknown function DUF1621 [Methanothrix thermoacetophila PT]MBC7079205.1 cell division protein SepF [Methanothrix sp.]NPU86669.1 cell division protein SepF [Methanothrix sp.]